MLWQQGAQQKAIAQLEEACRLKADDATAHVRLAEMYLAIGRTDASRQSVETALSLNLRLASAWAVRGRLMRAAGDLRQALDDQQRALGYAPGDRQVLAEIAAIYWQFRQPQRTLESLQSLAETYAPDEPPPHLCYSLGLAYEAVGRFDNAVQRLAIAARDRPTPELLYRLGEAQWLAGWTSAAKNTLQRALAMAPQHGPSRDLLDRIDLASRQNLTMHR